MKTYHYIYETHNPLTDEYYIGKHSTDNLDDGYQGSGRWVTECKDNNIHLVTTILQQCDSSDDAYALEAKIITQHRLTDSYCMNRCLGGKRGFMVSMQTGIGKCTRGCVYLKAAASRKALVKYIKTLPHDFSYIHNGITYSNRADLLAMALKI